MAKVSDLKVRRRLTVGNAGTEVIYPLPYTSYVAVLNQAGTAAPTATVLKNNLGGTIVLARSGIGVYTLTLTGAFPTATKVVIFLTVASGSTAVGARGVRTDANVVTISTFSSAEAAADLVGNLFTEIRVYA